MRAEQLLKKQPLCVTEVWVKNTFIHVEDVAVPMARSKSDSELSNTWTRSSIFFTGPTLISGDARPTKVTTASAQAPQSRNETVRDKDNSQAGEWSIGAAQHDAGKCKPCAYYTTDSCWAGRACRFCHLPHHKRNRARPNKAKRAQAKAAVAMIGKHHPGSPDQLADILCRMGSECGANYVDLAYLRKVVASRKTKVQEPDKAEGQFKVNV